ncbi:Hypothetical protein PBC10988_32770 [Planctomycetales bacterium 10988]|nr:Hypothetical protein PBC10988_32770 [Planctomycetales bacterium 10988]
MSGENPECLLCDAKLQLPSLHCSTCDTPHTRCNDCEAVFPAKDAFCPFCGAPSFASASEIDPSLSPLPASPSIEPQPQPKLPNPQDKLDQLAGLFQQTSQPDPAPNLQPPTTSQPSGALQPLAPSTPPSAEASSPEDANMQALLAGFGLSGDAPPQDLASPVSPQTPQAMRPSREELPDWRTAGGPLVGGFGSDISFNHSDDPILIEIDGSEEYRAGEQGVLRLRLLAQNVEEDAIVRLKIESKLLAKPVPLEAEVQPGQAYHFPAMAFVPQIAGRHPLQFTVALETISKVPLGKWSSSHVVKVEEAPQQENQAISAGGDVIIMGGGNRGQAAEDYSFGEKKGWVALPLQPDRAFNRRVKALKPPTIHGMPELPSDWYWPVGTQLLASLFVADHHTGRSQVIAFVCGTTASMGRGGDPSIAWWLRPHPHDPHQFGRLSRRHTVLTLHEGRAWIEDVSTNGTWLEDQRLEKRDPQLLAEEDHFAPADVVRFVPTLVTYEDAVEAIFLQREDGLMGRLSYCLASGKCPLPLKFSGSPEIACWLLWQKQPQMGPQLLIKTDETDWQPLGPHAAQVLNQRYRIQWQLLSSPIEQQAYLGQLAF